MAVCDRIGLFVLFLVAAFCTLAENAVGWADTPSDIATMYIKAALYLVVPVWGLLRVVDALSGGPRRRGEF